MTGIKIGSSKQPISTIAIAICSLGIISCAEPQNNAFKEAPTNTALAAKPNASVNSQTPTLPKADPTKQTSREQPKVGTVKSMVTGDLMCYLTLVDENNVEHQVGADFDICVNKNTYLNRKVRLSYKLVSINDCQSAEPCGRTRKEWLVTKMELVGEGNPQRR